MRILYFGGGYVGTCSAAASADSGHDVLVYDIDEEKTRKFSGGDKNEIESCLYENGLAELIARNKDRLRFTADIGEAGRALDEARAVFMCLPTPEKDGSGETDMRYYDRAADELGRLLAARNGGKQSNYVIVVNKSTVPISTAERLKAKLDGLGVVNYGIGSNPEFLVEGKAVEGSIRPSRVVVGAWSEKDFSIFRDIYKRFYESPNTIYIEVNPPEAETGKLLANFTLFKRLAGCFDVVGRVCEHFDDLHFENIRKILISDNRIGEWGFYNSMFAGGSCFIKDSRSLSFQLKEKGADTSMIDHVLGANSRQLERFMSRPEKELGYDWSGKRIAIVGLAFKRDTNDVRNAASLGAASFLLDRGIGSVRAFDPVAGDNFLRYFSGHHDCDKIRLAKSENEAFEDADAVLVATDWPQFRELAGEIMKRLPRGSLVMDGRRMLASRYGALSEAGYTVIAVGSPTMRKTRDSYPERF